MSKSNLVAGLALAGLIIFGCFAPPAMAVPMP